MPNNQIGSTIADLRATQSAVWIQACFGDEAKQAASVLLPGRSRSGIFLSDGFRMETSAVPRMTALALPEHAPSLSIELRWATGLNPARCYQCGKCSAGCPMGSEMTLAPHQIIRLVQLDQRARLFADSSMWLCLTCETCTARCPNGVDPARLIDGLREIAVTEGVPNAPRRIRAFHRAFLDQVRAHGRVFELGLVVWYKLRSGALFDDLLNAPGMFLRGKLKLAPEDLHGAGDVRRIFDACLSDEEDR